ncbi:MAG: N-acetylmuramoyl-L-alanine amidase-like domain-containing protein [Flavobacteriaceae bacterium]
MRIIIILFIFLSATFSTTAQHFNYSDEDLQAFKKKVEQIKKLDQPNMGRTVVEIGKTFAGMPYVGKTLEIYEDEKLVINLRGFDCTTYVENVLAFSLLLKKEADEFEAFGSILKNIRYRDGDLEGYSSRLHYFSEWLINNEVKGLVRNITCELGGVKFNKEINFMTSHRKLYPSLQDNKSFEDVRITEERLSVSEFCYIPKSKISDVEARLADGDIIALATSIDGLDVTHTGFAHRKGDGRIYLLHASVSGQVEISEKPLTKYLEGIKNNIGILVARPL